jgi:hypothetical protein
MTKRAPALRAVLMDNMFAVFAAGTYSTLRKTSFLSAEHVSSSTTSPTAVADSHEANVTTWGILPAATAPAIPFICHALAAIPLEVSFLVTVVAGLVGNTSTLLPALPSLPVWTPCLVNPGVVCCVTIRSWQLLLHQQQLRLNNCYSWYICHILDDSLDHAVL